MLNYISRVVVVGGFSEDSKAAPKTRSPVDDASDRRRARDTRDDLPKAAGKRNRLDELDPTFAVDRMAAKAHAQWRNASLND